MMWTCTPTGLAPFDQAAVDFMRHCDGEPFELKHLHSRDMRLHNGCFGVLHELSKALGTPMDLVRAELLFQTGKFQMIGELFGRSVIAVDSMSRSAMSDKELRAWWAEAEQIIRKSMLPRISDASERQRLEELLLLVPA
jgi:hypothetical protein